MPPPTNTRHELANSIANLPQGSVAQGDTNPRQWLKLTLGVRRCQKLPYLPGLPRTRTPMTRAALRASYGADPVAVARIQAFAARHHLVVTKDERLSARLGLSGTVTDLCAAFDVGLVDYTHPELGDFHARTSAVSLADEINGAVTGVFGFNNHRILRRTRAGSPALPGAATSCVGLMEFGRCVNERELAAHFARKSEPPPVVTIVNLNGTSNIAVCDSASDVMLDVEAANAQAAGGRIAVYFSTCDAKGLVDCVAKIVDDEDNAPQVVAINWGCDESQPLDGHIVWSPATIEHVNESFLALAHLGVIVCVATDEAQARDGQAFVSFPATSPYVHAAA